MVRRKRRDVLPAGEEQGRTGAVTSEAWVNEVDSRRVVQRREQSKVRRPPLVVERDELGAVSYQQGGRREERYEVGAASRQQVGRREERDETGAASRQQVGRREERGETGAVGRQQVGRREGTEVGWSEERCEACEREGRCRGRDEARREEERREAELHEEARCEQAQREEQAEVWHRIDFLEQNLKGDHWFDTRDQLDCLKEEYRKDRSDAAWEHVAAYSALAYEVYRDEADKQQQVVFASRDSQGRAVYINGRDPSLPLPARAPVIVPRWQEARMVDELPSVVLRRVDFIERAQWGDDWLVAREQMEFLEGHYHQTQTDEAWQLFASYVTEFCKEECPEEQPNAHQPPPPPPPPPLLPPRAISHAVLDVEAHECEQQRQHEREQQQQDDERCRVTDEQRCRLADEQFRLADEQRRTAEARRHAEDERARQRDEQAGQPSKADDEINEDDAGLLVQPFTGEDSDSIDGGFETWINDYCPRSTERAYAQGIPLDDIHEYKLHHLVRNLKGHALQFYQELDPDTQDVYDDLIQVFLQYFQPPQLSQEHQSTPATTVKGTKQKKNKRKKNRHKKTKGDQNKIENLNDTGISHKDRDKQRKEDELGAIQLFKILLKGIWTIIIKSKETSIDYTRKLKMSDIKTKWTSGERYQQIYVGTSSRYPIVLRPLKQFPCQTRPPDKVQRQWHNTTDNEYGDSAIPYDNEADKTDSTQGALPHDKGGRM